jgi:prevent-host-death family protein
MHRFSDDLRPMSDLKSAGAEIVRQAQTTGRPVVLTRHGRGVAVVLSVEAYDDLAADAGLRALREAVAEADAELARGEALPHDDVAAEFEQRLRRDER